MNRFFNTTPRKILWVLIIGALLVSIAWPQEAPKQQPRLADTGNNQFTSAEDEQDCGCTVTVVDLLLREAQTVAVEAKQALDEWMRCPWCKTRRLKYYDKFLGGTPEDKANIRAIKGLRDTKTRVTENNNVLEPAFVKWADDGVTAVVTLVQIANYKLSDGTLIQVDPVVAEYELKLFGPEDHPERVTWRVTGARRTAVNKYLAEAVLRMAGGFISKSKISLFPSWGYGFPSPPRRLDKYGEDIELQSLTTGDAGALLSDGSSATGIRSQQVDETENKIRQAVADALVAIRLWELSAVNPDREIPDREAAVWAVVARESDLASAIYSRIVKIRGGALEVPMTTPSHNQTWVQYDHTIKTREAIVEVVDVFDDGREIKRHFRVQLQTNGSWKVVSDVNVP